MRTCRSGLPPATHAAVACDIAAAQPELTMPHSAPVSSASRLPTAAMTSSSCACCWLAALLAARTSGSSIDPPMTVKRAAAVDERTDADRLVDARLGGRCSGGGSRRRAALRGASAGRREATVPAPTRLARRSRWRRAEFVFMCVELSMSNGPPHASSPAIRTGSKRGGRSTGADLELTSSASKQVLERELHLACGPRAADDPEVGVSQRAVRIAPVHPVEGVERLGRNWSCWPAFSRNDFATEMSSTFRPGPTTGLRVEVP